jgi:guanosine-3',5'-bis(diphosphate) 3'-pyrophosphohydrolase
VASIQQEFLLDKISSVKVNGNLAMLSDKVKPGDVVEVISSATRIVPEIGWLKIVNPATARLLRSVLAVEDLRQAAEMGKKQLKNVLNERGILALEDVQALYPEKIIQLLETTSTANLQDLYSAIGSGAIRITELANELDEIGISREKLNWTTINIQSGLYANRPGVLAKLAGLVSDSGGNIVRSVNNTMPDGGFYLRLVVENMKTKKHDFMDQASEISGIKIIEIDMVP